MTDDDRRFRAAIFDLDGLLVDSEPLWQRAEIECFGAVGVPLTVEQARETIGLRSDVVVRRRYEEFGWDVAKHPLVTVESRIVDRVVELLATTAHPMPGALEALDLFSARGLRLGLASSSRMVVIEAALRALGLGERFEAVHSGEFETLGKPDPGVYLTTARLLELPSSGCLAIEDSVAGLEAAKAAGMGCIMVPDPHVTRFADLSAADLVLSSLTELELRLGSIFQG